MTTDELKQLFQTIAITQKETGKQIQELRASEKETRIQSEKDAIIQRKNNLTVSNQIQELRASEKETRIQSEKDAIIQRENNLAVSKQIKELGKQIGGLAKRIGSFTEGLALPSMQKILQSKFKMEVISPSVRVRKGGKEIEIDVLAYANSNINEVYIVEVKSHLREEGIYQLQNIVKNFRTFFPEHSDKKVYGIIAAVDMSAALKKRVLSLGFYTAIIHEEVFSLDVPQQFSAKAY